MSSENSINREVVIKIALNSYPYKTLFNEEEFKKDFCRFYVIRKMSKRFLLTNQVSDKLLINNIIICLNIFGIKAVNMILQIICEEKEFEVIKSCLIFLNSLSLDDHTHNKIMLSILKNIKHRYTFMPLGGDK